jgi:flagellar biosynthesis/type III secretory pathway M-ring protein FliF/YscJ
MKKLKYFCLAFLVAFLLAIPVAAQKGEKGERNNNASKQKGKARAEQVQAGNKKGDKDPSPTKGSKNKGKHEGLEKKAKQKAKGHS